MQCNQADYRHFENGTQGSVSSSLWTFKLEFGIVHTGNCSVCRSYMTHVAVANHSGDASFKDALNNREDRVSTAFLDGLQGGRQMQQEHDGPVLSRYRDERNKALQALGTAKKEMAILRDRILALELVAQDPVSGKLSKRRDEVTSSITESPAKSDISSVERLLLGPSEDLDALSTPFLSTVDDHDTTLIPNLPTPAEAREALQTETPDPIQPLGSSPSFIEPLGETIVSHENVLQSSALLLKASSSATPEPPNPLPQPSTCALSSSNSSASDQQYSSVKPLGEINGVSITSVQKPKTWEHFLKTSPATPNSAKLSPQPLTNALSPSISSDQLPLSVAPLMETKVSTPIKSRAKTSTSAVHKPEELLSPSSTNALSLSNPSSSDQLPSFVEPPEETNISTADVPKPRAQQQAKASSSATPESAKPSPRPSTCTLNLLNPSSSDQQLLSVESPGETNASTTKVSKSWAQLVKGPSSATSEPAKSSPRSSICMLGLPNPSSDQQSSSLLTTSPGPRPLTTIAHLDALMKAAHGGDDSSLTRIKTFCATAHRTPRKQRTELQRHALLYWRNRSPSVSSSMPSSVPGPKMGTGIVHTTVGDGTFSTEIHVDSSAWGIGFVMDGLWLAWKFSDLLTHPGKFIDNNWAEMLAVEVGLWTVIHWVRSVIQKEGDVIKSLEIIVCSDNAGVVKAIEKRHSNFPPQQDILLRILDMISEYNIQLSMKWISSMDNVADSPSRGVPGTAVDLLPFIPPLPSYLSDTLLSP